MTDRAPYITKLCEGVFQTEEITPEILDNGCLLIDDFEAANREIAREAQERSPDTVVKIGKGEGKHTFRRTGIVLAERAGLSRLTVLSVTYAMGDTLDVVTPRLRRNEPKNIFLGLQAVRDLYNDATRNEVKLGGIGPKGVAIIAKVLDEATI